MSCLVLACHPRLYSVGLRRFLFDYLIFQIVGYVDDNIINEAIFCAGVLRKPLEFLSILYKPLKNL